MPPEQEEKLTIVSERHPEEKMRSWAKAQIASFYDLRKKAMILEEADPYRYGYEPDDWKLADERMIQLREKHPVGVLIGVIFGGIRSSKTEWKAKRLVQNMVTRSNYKAWQCHSTQDSSREAQQEKIYKYLPAEFRPDSGRYRHGKDTKVNYTPWGGFTDDVFTIPGMGTKPSECRFKFYSMNPKALEGSEIDEGAMDEEAPIDWLDILVGRATTRNGIVYLTFNAKNGYTQLVRAILNNARTVTEVDAELLLVKNATDTIGVEKVPKIQQNLGMVIPSGEDGKDKRSMKAEIIYFHTKNNPYAGYETMKENLAGASREKIMIEAYGIPSTSRKAQFPLFNDSVHIISLNLFREIQKNGGTWYHYLDPCSGRNWFMHWVFIDPLERKFVVAEFPSYGHEWAYVPDPAVGMPDPWALPGNAEDGSIGGGQKEWGWGYTQYVEEIARIEALISNDGNRVKIHERWIDARYGNARRTDEENPTTLIIDLSTKYKMDFLAAPSEKSINAGHGGGDGSLRMINDLLYYDKSKPIDSINTPKLFLVETCPNTEFSLKNWTGRDGQKGASKDPIDCLRMMCLTDARYIATESFRPIVHSHFRR